MRVNRQLVISVLIAPLLLSFYSPGFSQTPFFQGKTITIIRGSAPGGVGEMRTRAVANYLKKHVPGNPTVIIEFMAGAGGTKAANHLYRGARADGLIIGSAPSGMVSSAILGEAGVQYDLDKFIYLGSPNSESHYVFFTNRKLGLGSLEKLRAHSGLRIGAQTVGHPIYLYRSPVRFDPRFEGSQVCRRLLFARAGCGAAERRARCSAGRRQQCR